MHRSDPHVTRTVMNSQGRQPALMEAYQKQLQLQIRHGAQVLRPEQLLSGSGKTLLYHSILCLHNYTAVHNKVTDECVMNL